MIRKPNRCAVWTVSAVDLWIMWMIMWMNCTLCEFSWINAGYGETVPTGCTWVSESGASIIFIEKRRSCPESLRRDGNPPLLDLSVGPTMFFSRRWMLCCRKRTIRAACRNCYGDQVYYGWVRVNPSLGQGHGEKTTADCWIDFGSSEPRNGHFYCRFSVTDLEVTVERQRMMVFTAVLESLPT